MSLSMEELKVTRNEFFCMGDDMQDDTDKLDNITSKFSHVESLVELIAFELWSSDLATLIRLHAHWESDSDRVKSDFYRKRQYKQATIKDSGPLPGSATVPLPTEKDISHSSPDPMTDINLNPIEIEQDSTKTITPFPSARSS